MERFRVENDRQSDFNMSCVEESSPKIELSNGDDLQIHLLELSELRVTADNVNHPT